MQENYPTDAVIFIARVSGSKAVRFIRILLRNSPEQDLLTTIDITLKDFATAVAGIGASCSIKYWNKGQDDERIV
jgi:hypothetical protein